MKKMVWNRHSRLAKVSRESRVSLPRFLRSLGPNSQIKMSFFLFWRAVFTWELVFLALGRKRKFRVSLLSSDVS